ncbi:MAG: hypothetical protein Q6365_019525 [Candidatus Sigynarchaeota archaeon]
MPALAANSAHAATDAAMSCVILAIEKRTGTRMPHVIHAAATAQARTRTGEDGEKAPGEKYTFSSRVAAPGAGKEGSWSSRSK